MTPVSQLREDIETVKELKERTKETLLSLGFEDDEIGSWMEDFNRIEKSYLAIINLLNKGIKA